MKNNSFLGRLKHRWEEAHVFAPGPQTRLAKNGVWAQSKFRGANEQTSRKGSTVRSQSFPGSCPIVFHPFARQYGVVVKSMDLGALGWCSWLITGRLVSAQVVISRL